MFTKTEVAPIRSLFFWNKTWSPFKLEEIMYYQLFYSVSGIPIFFKKQVFDRGNEEHEDIQRIREKVTEKARL